MNKNIMVISLASLIFASNMIIPTQAAYAVQNTTGETITIKVKGLFCDLCRTKMQKRFGKIAGVQKVRVNLESGFVTIDMVKGKTLPNNLINKIIKDTGYTPISIKRS